MASLLKGVAYITGAGSGIGQYTAYAFARHGVKRMALTDIRPENLQNTIDKLKKDAPDVEVEAIQMDAAKEEDVNRSIEQTVKRFGSLDYAVNNAGIAGPSRGTADVEFAEWQKLMDVNLNGVWLCQRAQLRQMLKQDVKSLREGRGVIVNVASMLGTVASAPVTPATAYTASKHGVMGLTKTDAIFYAPQNIRINAICPGYVETPLLQSASAAGAMDLELKKVPMGRLAKMEEIADAIVFLSSPMSSFMCGAGLLVDGGYTAQ